MSSATYASRLSAGRYSHARPARWRRANPFLASRSSTVMTVVWARPRLGRLALTCLTVIGPADSHRTSMMARSRSPSRFITTRYEAMPRAPQAPRGDRGGPAGRGILPDRAPGSIGGAKGRRGHADLHLPGRHHGPAR